MNGIDPRDFAITDSFVSPKGKVKRKRHLDTYFIKGPIPLPWLIKAANLGGKASLVGLCLWFKKGLTNQKSFRIGGGDISKLVKVNRRTALRVIRKLETAGLILVLRQVGSKLVVTINHEAR